MPGELSDYEKLRLKNIEENRKILAGLGIVNAFNTTFKVIKKAPKRKRPASTPTQRKSVKVENGSTENQGSSYKTGIRRSSRLRGQDAPSLEDMELETSQADDEDVYRRPKLPKHRPNFYGFVEGVEIGTLWQTRLECCYAGIHRPTVAGIHGGEDGCYSIALSGGYEDDIDLGDSFTYTGEGGRDLKGTKSNPKNLRTAPQSKDQTLTRGNLALSQNVETGNPVRVIRGYKLQSPFAPEEGYRYDGLYRVEKYWFTTGMSGFGVYKFVLRRLEDQAPPPWEIEDYDQKAKISPKYALDEDCRSDSAYGSNHGDKSDTESIESKDTTDKEKASPVSSSSEHEEQKDTRNPCCGSEQEDEDAVEEP